MNWNCVTFLQMEGGMSLVTATRPNYRFPHEKTVQTRSKSSFRHRLSYFLHCYDKLPSRNKCRHCGQEGVPMGGALSSVGCVVRQLGIQPNSMQQSANSISCQAGLYPPKACPTVTHFCQLDNIPKGSEMSPRSTTCCEPSV